MRKGNTIHDEMEEKMHIDDLSCHVLCLDSECIKEVHARWWIKTGWWKHRQLGVEAQNKTVPLRVGAPSQIVFHYLLSWMKHAHGLEAMLYLDEPSWTYMSKQSPTIMNSPTFRGPNFITWMDEDSQRLLDHLMLS